MEEQAVRGVPWTLLTYALTRGLLLITTVLLARLLEPADFGIVALGLLVVTFARLLSDLGLGSTILYRPDLDERALGTVLTLMVASGVAAAAVLAAAAPVLARLLAQPRLTLVLVALAGILLMNGLIWFHEQLIVRELAFRRRFVSQLTQSVTYAVTAPLLALAGAGVWSLVLGQLASIVAFTIALLLLAPFHVRPRFDRAVARDIFDVSRGFLALGALTFLRQNVDYVIVGRILGATPLGYYSMAYRLTELPSSAVAEPVARVTFPAFSRMRTRGEDVSVPFLRTLRLVALVTVPMGVFVSSAAGPITRLVFGDDWLPMITALSVLGLWGALRPSWTTMGWYLNSVGAAGSVARVTGITLPGLAVAAAVAASLGTIATVAWVVTAELVSLTIVYAVLARRFGGVPLRRQAQALLPAAVGGTAAWVVGRAMVTWLESGSLVVAVAAAAVGAAAVYVAVAHVTAPGVIGDVLRQGRRAVGRATVAGPPADGTRRRGLARMLRR